MNQVVLVLLFVGVAVASPWGKKSYGHGSSHGGRHGEYSPQRYQSKYDQQPLSYGYMQNPMAQVYMRPAMPATQEYSPYHGQSFLEKMLGEQHFKHAAGYPHNHNDDKDEESDSESLPYTVVRDFGPYEEREYPSAKFACVKADIDNSKDPFAGLEKMNPFDIMKSKRYQKRPSSYMFKALFKYISGVNKEYTEMEMTRPVSTHHSVKKVQFGGDLEVQEMCFYIPAEHQASPPTPLDTSPVFIHQRPSMHVYVLRFGGFMMTADQWQEKKDLLEDLIMGKPHHDSEYYTNGYNSPWTMTNRRNEVWIQSLEAGPPVIAAVVAEPEDEDEGQEDVSADVDA